MEALAGRTIAIAESRELELLASMLERRGARVLRYPMVHIVDAPDPAPVLRWLNALAAGGCDDLILLTGEGLRRLLRCIDTHEPALRPAFIAALGTVRRITRGPKPARALRELGLASDLAARVPTSAGLIETLREESLSGRRVFVQLYGDDPNRALTDFLAGAGAIVSAVAPYRYADGPGAGAVAELLGEIEKGGVDAIAFTSKAQIERLFAGAADARIRSALSRVAVAAVGPVVSECLRQFGVAVAAEPEVSWFMKPLVTALAERLGEGS